jgi:hypothetical protein
MRASCRPGQEMEAVSKAWASLPFMPAAAKKVAVKPSAYACLAMVEEDAPRAAMMEGAPCRCPLGGGCGRSLASCATGGGGLVDLCPRGLLAKEGMAQVMLVIE